MTAHSGGESRVKQIVDMASTVLTMLAATAVLAWVGMQWIQRNGQQVKTPGAPVSLKGIPLKGSTDASLALIVFSDFECPFCGTFARESMPGLVREFVDTGIAKVGFVHYPLESIHKRAFRAAEAAACAGRQDRFWEMHDLIFEDQKRLDDDSFVDRAARTGIDATAFGECLDGQATEEVRSAIRLTQSVGLATTPAFIVGRIQSNGDLKAMKVFSGANSYADIAGFLRSPTGVSPGAKWFMVITAIALGMTGALLWRRRARTRSLAHQQA